MTHHGTLTADYRKAALAVHMVSACVACVCTSTVCVCVCVLTQTLFLQDNYYVSLCLCVSSCELHFFISTQ